MLEAVVDIDVCGISQVSGLVPNLLSSTSQAFMCPGADIEVIWSYSRFDWKYVPPGQNWRDVVEAEFFWPLATSPSPWIAHRDGLSQKWSCFRRQRRRKMSTWRFFVFFVLPSMLPISLQDASKENQSESHTCCFKINSVHFASRRLARYFGF